MTWVDRDEVQQVVMTGQEIKGTGRNGDFHTYAPAQFEGLANQLIEKGVKVDAKEPAASPWTQLLYSYAPLLLMLGFYIFFLRQMQSGGNKALSFGKSKAK